MTREYPTTAEQIASHNLEFRAACERAGVKPTKRQASKYRRGFGSAFKHRNPSS